MKKMTLFFDRKVWKEMESNAVFATLPGLHKAIRLPSEVLESVLICKTVQEARVLGGDAWEFFQPNCQKRRELLKAIDKTQRIESIVSFNSVRESVIRLEMFFYCKSGKVPFFGLWFNIVAESATECLHGGTLFLTTT